MAKVFTNDENYEDIANAIREQNGESETYTPAEMGGAIRALSTNIPPRSIDEDKLANDSISTRTIQAGAVTSKKIGTGQVTEGKIADEAVNYQKLGTDVKGIIESKITYDEIEIDSMSDLNAPYLADSFQKFGVKFTDSAATSAGVENGTIGELNSVEVDGSIFRYITFPEIESYKLVQEVYSVAPSWSASSWTVLDNRTRINTLEIDIINKISKGDYSIAFDENGIAYKSQKSTSFSASGDFTTAKSFYCSPYVTELTSGFFTTAPALTDLYIDSAAGVVDLPGTIPERITIHYANEFKLIDLIVNSITAQAVQMNDIESRVTTLETTIGTLDSAIDSELNLE